ncbi:FAD-binding domain-containing protein OS=Streptomyces microflavus OX=1919 GN=Smic_03450 PE=4 SV=1 [Streptomyces microflavus]
MRDMPPEPVPPDPRAGEDAQVIVVGAGPAGSSAAYHLARAGVDVILLKKARFPREKVCGDGLARRAVHQLIRMGVDISAPGWTLRAVCGGWPGEHRVHIDWPTLGRYRERRLSRSRHDFDDILAHHAVAAGARLYSGWKAERPLVDPVGVIGVVAAAGPPEVPGPVGFRAPVGGAAAGGRHRPARPARRIERDPARADLLGRPPITQPGALGGVPGLSSHRELPGQGPSYSQRLDLPDRRRGSPSGWGTATAGTGSRICSPPCTIGWPSTPKDWGLLENVHGSVRSAALPLGFNRHPLNARGLLLAGDSGGCLPVKGEPSARPEAARILKSEKQALQKRGRRPVPAASRVIRGEATERDTP